MPQRFLIEIPGPSEQQLEEWQYSAYPDEVAEYPPPSLITGSTSAQPGAFLHNPLHNRKVAYVDAAQTTILYASDPNGGEYIVPIQSAWEEGNLPHETRHYLPLHATIVMIEEENLESAASFQDTLKLPHTHPTAPHLGIFTSQKTKEEYRKHQIGEEPIVWNRRGPVDADSLIGPDKVPWK